jgi:hypothetical protein
MERILPRWGWRTFGDLGAAETGILSRGASRAIACVETHVVSRASSHGTEIRDGCVNVRKLDAVDSGLERWKPVLRSRFPLTAEVVTDVFAAWNVTAPSPLDGAAYSLEEFLGGFVRTHTHLSSVVVEKEGRALTIGVCAVEFARLTLDGTPTFTAAVEAEDPLAVLQTVRSLGLDGLENISYVRALKRLRGIPVV